jgi:hypothetical protein
MQYELEHDEKNKQFIIKLFFSHKIHPQSDSTVYSLSIPEDKENIKNETIRKLDILMNVKKI